MNVEKLEIMLMSKPMPNEGPNAQSALGPSLELRIGPSIGAFLGPALGPHGLQCRIYVKLGTQKS